MSLSDINAKMPVNELATLAMLADTAQDERPSGETAEAHANRIFAGINQQLSNKELATAGQWKLLWLARSTGNTNVAFVAQNQGTNAIAVSFRGTLFSSFADIMEDIQVGSVVALPVSVNGKTRSVGVSAGAMQAFTEVMNAVSSSASGRYANMNLMTVLQSLLNTAPGIYVVGHSLGGAMATVVGLYLQGQTWGGAKPRFLVCSFAAPTAGVQSFADAFKEAFPAQGPNVAAQIVNTYDVVPQAWNNLPVVGNSWYSTDALNGPSAKIAGTDSLYTVIAPGFTNGQTYVQPCEQTPCNLKDGVPTYIPDPKHVISTSENWNAQVGFQHGCYLSLLGAKDLPPGPFVTGIDVTTGSTVDDTTVTISGVNFTSDCVVDFGAVAAQVKEVQQNQITAIARPGFGIADVTVTNSLGTSPATPAGAFAFGGPEPLGVTSITQDSYQSGATVTINGNGLSQVTSVVFTYPPDLLSLSNPPAPVPVTNFQVHTDKQIQVKAPARPAWGAKGAPVNATVAVVNGDLCTQAGSVLYTK